VGAITLDSHDPARRFGPDDLRLLQTVTAGMGVALENVRLFDDTRHLLDETERRNAELALVNGLQQSLAARSDFDSAIDVIGEALRRAFADEDIAIDWLSSDSLPLQPFCLTALYEVREGLRVAPTLRATSQGSAFLRAAHTRQPVLMTTRAAQKAAGDGVRGLGCTCSGLLVPIFGEKDILGAIVLENRYREGAYDETTVRLLTTIAQTAGLALENDRLFNETRQALERQTATSDLLRVISGSPTEVGPVFEEIVATAVRLLGCDVAWALRCAGNHYVRVAGATPEGPLDLPQVAEQPVDPQADFVSRAIVNRQPLDLPDWSDLDLPTHDRVRHREGLRCGLYLPLLHHGECYGVLAFASRRAHAFGREQRRLAESLRDQALIAIQNVHLFNETREALQRQTATAEVLQVIGHSVADTQPVFDRILDSCERLIACTDLRVMTVDEDGLVHLESIRGVSERRVHHPAPRPVGQTVLAQAIAERRTMHYPDVLYAQGLPERLRRMAASVANFSCVVAPMVLNDRGIGAIVVVRMFAARQWPDFTDKEIALVQTFADQAVIAIQNARLFRETQEALQQQKASADVLAVISSSVADTQPVFEKILQSCQRLFNGDELDVLLVDDRGMLRIAAYMGTSHDIVAATFPAPVDRTPAGQALRERRAVHWPDLVDGDNVPGVLRKMAQLIGYRSIVFAPMLWNDQGIGAIGVARSTGPFKPKELALLQTFADQAVIAIQNARLFRETQEALEQQRASAEVLSVISASVADATPVFDKILDSCERLFGTDQLCIYVVDDDAVVCSVAWRGSIAADVGHNEVALADSVTGQVIRDRKARHIPDALALPDLPEHLRPWLERIGNLSVVYAPMLWEDRGIGSIAVMRQPPRPFTEKELALLQAYADQAAIAIQNARLFNETQEALERQTATAEVLQVISRSMANAQPVFETILDSCQ
ncbi:MAG: GAF domain-containing protein, partial [Burkholderiaceae bacterium]